jgi:hypothetical protein
LSFRYKVPIADTNKHNPLPLKIVF